MAEPVSVKQESKLLLKHSSIYGMAPAVSRLVGFLMIPVYTAYLAPADYGVMELLFATTSLLEMVVGVGISHGVTRFYFDSEDQTERNKVISSAFLGLGGILLPVILGLIAASGLLSELVLKTDAYTSLFVISFISMGLAMLNNINIAYLRAEKKSLFVVLSSTSQLIISLSLNIFFIVYMKMGVAGIFWGNLVATALVMGAVTPLVFRKVGMAFNGAVVKGLVKFGLPLIPSNIASYIVVASDRFFINEYVSTAQTGIYSLGYKFGSLVMNFATSPFNQIYGPRRFELFKREGASELFGRIFTYFVGVIVFGGLAISLVAKDLVYLMAADASYYESWRIIPLITMAHIILSFFYHFNIGIYMEKQTKYFAYINVSNGLLNLGLNFLLIPRYGIWGAAWATTICYFYRSAATYWISSKLHKIYLDWGRVLVVFGVALAFYLLFAPLDVGNLFANIAIKGAICCFFPIVLYLIRFFNAEEKAFIHEVLGKLWRKVRRR